MSANKKDKMALAENMVKILAIVTGVLCLIALGLLGAAAWMQHTSGSLGRMQNQVKAVKKTSEDLESLIVVTQTIMNSASGEAERTITAAKLEETKEIATTKKAELESEKADLSSTLNDIGTPVDREAGNNALSLINKELLLIERFEDANKYTYPYVQLRPDLLTALDKLVQADSSDRQASAQLMAGNTDDANKSIESANSAKDLVLQAKAMFEQVKLASGQAQVQLVSSSTFDEYVTYCQLIADAQDAAIASANAYVARNKDELAVQNDAYNKCKEQAAAISGKWEKQITELWADAFFEARQGEIDGFNQDLKERDSLFNSVSNYLKGKE